MRRRPIAERFWEKVQKGEKDDCWLWTATISKNGYGHLGSGVRALMTLAHRCSWEIHNGPVPHGLCVLHKCDVRACVNPDHLFLGTSADNMADKVKKGRQASGSRNGRAKLSPTTVRAIRDDRRINRAIAAEYGIGTSQVGRIKRQDHWRDA